MTSVRVKFRQSAVKGKEGALYIQLIHNRRTKLVTTRFRLFPAEWDRRSAAVVINKGMDNERALYLQNIRDGLETELRQVYGLIALLGRRGTYTVDELAEHYASHSFNGYFFPFMQYRIRQLRAENRTGTASICETARRSFSRFRHGEDIRMDKIDGVLMQRYETFLKQDNVSPNSISCYMRALRSAYNQAVSRGLCSQRQPFAEVYTGVDKTIKRAVSEDVVIRLKQLDLSSKRELEKARDLFLFSFYMRGMPFVDMANLRQCNLKNGHLVYTRSKTKQVLTVKVEKCMEDIIGKYAGQTTGDYLLPVYTAGNHSHIGCLRTYNKRLKRISGLLQLEKPLSSYVARHSWATIALRRGISVQVISEGMGHENEKTTRIYLASLEQSVIDDANARIIAL